MARISKTNDMQPKICKCCGQYINPPRRQSSASRKSSKPRVTDRFLPAESISNHIDDFHWEFGTSDVSLKDAYLSVRDRHRDDALENCDIYEPLWDSVAYFVFTVEHHVTRDAALQRMLRCNPDSRAIKPSSVGLIVSDTEYCSFEKGDGHAGI